MTSNISIDNKAIEGTAMPFPYPKIIHRAIGCNDRRICRETALPCPDFG
ncbi:hypothetical protein [Microcoleus sp. T3_D1]